MLKKLFKRLFRPALVIGTKQWRNKMYRLALAEYKYDICRNRYCGICSELKAVSYVDSISQYFPEFWAMYPYSTELNRGCHWWPKESTGVRIEALEQCINLTK
jgi:hypothetical protein